MRIENKSAYYPTARLQPLVDFASRWFKTNQVVVLQLTDGAEPSKVCGGYAYRDRVKMTLSRHAYPCTSEHVAEVGPVELRSFEEEFLLVLLHEVAHVNQFSEGRLYYDSNDAEVEAEMFAVKMLARYRRSTRKLAKTYQPSL